MIALICALVLIVVSSLLSIAIFGLLLVLILGIVGGRTMTGGRVGDPTGAVEWLKTSLATTTRSDTAEHTCQ